MAEKQTLTASQRATLFSQATRQNMQMLPTQTAQGGASTLTFTFGSASSTAGVWSAIYISP